MTTILFFSLTKAQYHYFQKLKKHLPFISSHLFFPNFFISLERPPKIEIEHILTTKYKEIDTKYRHVLKKTLYKKFIQFQVPWVLRVLYREMKKKPDFLVLWNGKKFHQALARALAKELGIKVIYFENGILPHTTTMDFKGVNASNSVPRQSSFYRSLHFDKHVKLPSNLVPRVSKRKSKSEISSALPERYIFVPFQVAYDTQIIQHSPCFHDMFALFKTLERLTEETSWHFVIKEHPSDRVSDYTVLQQARHPQIHFSSENTQYLIENAAAVMTINSSVAIEALLFKKKVIVLGEAFFVIDDLVKRACSAKDILEILHTLEAWKVDVPLIENFLSYLYVEYLIPGDWRDPDRKHIQRIEEKIKEEINR